MRTSNYTAPYSAYKRVERIVWVSLTRHVALTSLFARHELKVKNHECWSLKLATNTHSSDEISRSTRSIATYHVTNWRTKKCLVMYRGWNTIGIEQNTNNSHKQAIRYCISGLRGSKQYIVAHIQWLQYFHWGISPKQSAWLLCNRSLQNPK